MPYRFTEWEQEPAPDPSSGRSGFPPRKHIGIGTLDPPTPPGHLRGRLSPGPFKPHALWLRALVLLLLLAWAIFTLMLVLPYR
jgi:hypothetical protein